MNYAFLFAGGIAAFGFVICLMLGRRPPKPRDMTDPAALTDMRFARFAGLALLAAMTLAYADASRHASATDTALAISLFALVLAFARLAFAARARLRRLDVSEWGFHMLAGAVGLAGSDLHRWLPA